jgi:hypothetical protein
MEAMAAAESMGALVTIVGAGATIVLDFARIVDLSTAEEVIIALLALLAIDALTERIGVLERIEEKLRAGSLCLEGRGDFSRPLEERLASAGRVHLLGVSLVGIISQYQWLIIEKAKEGCQFKIITVAPEFYDLGEVPTSWYGSRGSKPNLEHTLFTIERIKERVGNGMVEVRRKGCTRTPPLYTHAGYRQLLV